MKLNEHTALLTPTVHLVPYRAHHVPKYHAWMQDAELQQLTASEPLSLEQEYEMCRSWREDADKLTFIAVRAPVGAESGGEMGVGRGDEEGEVQRMIGDVNMFVYEDDEGEDDLDSAGCGDSVGAQERSKATVGEIEIMIAYHTHRGQGYGRTVLLAFLWYILVSLSPGKDGAAQTWRQQLRALRVKIDKDNVQSIGLFQSVGFTKVGEGHNYFGEVELRWVLGNATREQIVVRLRGAGKGEQWVEPIVVRYD